MVCCCCCCCCCCRATYSTPSAPYRALNFSKAITSGKAPGPPGINRLDSRCSTRRLRGRIRYLLPCLSSQASRRPPPRPPPLYIMPGGNHWLEHRGPPSVRPISHGFARPPINHRMNFPQHYYFTRGAPVCRREMFTTYGYLIQNVPIGKGMLSQQPRPKDMSTTRHRHDARHPPRAQPQRQTDPERRVLYAAGRRQVRGAYEEGADGRREAAQAAADADGRIHAFARAEHIHADDAEFAIGEGREYTARVRSGREHPRSIAPQYGRVSEWRSTGARLSFFLGYTKK